MNKEVLDPKVYYYTDAIEDFDKFQSTLKDLDSLESENGLGVNVWNTWTASNDKDFIYGETKTFDINAINRLDGEIAEKSKYVYDSIMTTFYNVCKDYATSIGDFDEPRIFDGHYWIDTLFDRFHGEELKVDGIDVVEYHRAI